MKRIFIIKIEGNDILFHKNRTPIELRSIDFKILNCKGQRRNVLSKVLKIYKVYCDLRL